MYRYNERIAPHFGLKYLNATHGFQPILDNDDNEIGSVRVRASWIAQASYQPEREPYFERITVAVIKTDEWARGLLFSTPIESDEMIKLTSKPVVLSDWDDIVAQALQSINIFPEKATGASLRENAMFGSDFTITFSTWWCSGTLHGDTISPDAPEIDKLRRAIPQAIRYIVKKSENPQLKDYFE